MITALNYPFDVNYLLRKKKAIKRDLISGINFEEKRIAILGGSTTAEIKDMIELFLLNDGIKPLFYESEYNKFQEEILFDCLALKLFKPDLIYIHTSNVNINRYPSVNENLENIDYLILDEVNQYKRIWDRIEDDYACPVIQNNFEHPHYRVLGNLDAYEVHGRTRFIAELNRHFCEEARQRKNLHLNDINYLSAWYGLERWYDKISYYSFKYAMNIEAIPLLANNIASIIKAIFGKTKKGLVLDLDNTLWGGVIGDDGLNGISIGKETPQAEAYTDFQEYIKALKERGVILAVCSKNEEATAKEGFSHPDSILNLVDFSEFRSNWKPKHENIRDIACSLNIGIDSLVFADDNPSERNLVKSQFPQIKVPDLGNNIVKYIDIIDKSGLFDVISLSNEDLQRSSLYADNAYRSDSQSHFDNYEDFLRSLEMVAEIKPIIPLYLDRITQLTNKTNQFNLTTKRLTFGEIKIFSEDSRYLTLYGRLLDKFGDNGLVSVIIGVIKSQELHIDLWLMSCRVIKRGMEVAMLDQLVAKAKQREITSIIGYYYPTAKNNIVSGLYEELGFEMIRLNDDKSSSWVLDIAMHYTNKNYLIEVNI